MILLRLFLLHLLGNIDTGLPLPNDTKNSCCNSLQHNKKIIVEDTGSTILSIFK